MGTFEGIKERAKDITYVIMSAIEVVGEVVIIFQQVNVKFNGTLPSLASNQVFSFVLRLWSAHQVMTSYE